MSVDPKRTGRRAFAATAGAFATIGVVRARARPAQFVYKYGHDLTVEDPFHVRAVQMAGDIKRETGGRLEIQIFPNSILGSDPSMIEQVRTGALQFSAQAGPVLSGVAPAAAVQSIAYAFKSEQQAVGSQYGPFGDAIRRELALKTGFHVFPMVLDGGFRQLTSSTKPIRTASDFTGFKIRIRPGNVDADLYRTLGAEVAAFSINETYVALQTHLVDGQETTYEIIESMRYYEVQKYLSIMNSVWAGEYFYCNGDAWKALPSDIQAIVERNSILYGKRVYGDSQRLNVVLADKLRRQGLIFNVADRESMRTRLGPYYARAKALYGPALWGLLEQYSGKLA